jgi:hypothetical protein
MFEAGYCDVFDIPFGLISLNLQSIFIAAGGVLVFGIFFVIFPLNFFYALYFSYRRHYWFMAPATLFAATITFLVSFLVNPFLLWLGNYFFLLWLASRAEKTPEPKPRWWHLPQLVIGAWSGRGGVYAVIVLLYALSVPFYIGNTAAHAESGYWMSNTPERFTILRIYGDIIVTMPSARTRSGYAVIPSRYVFWATKGYVLLPELKLFKVGDRDTPTFSRYERGVLQVKWPAFQTAWPDTWWGGALRWVFYPLGSTTDELGSPRVPASAK